MNLLRKSWGTTSIVQLSSNQAVVSASYLISPQVLTLSSELKGVDVWDTRILAWRADGADMFEVGSAGAQHTAALKVTEGAFLAIHSSSIFQTEEDSIKVLDFQGAVKQILPLYEYQGKPVCLDVNQDFLVLATANCYIHMWKIDGADAKPFGPTLGRKMVIDDGGKVTSIRCNSDCSKISIQVKGTSRIGKESHIFVYDTVMDKFFSYNFRNQKLECLKQLDEHLMLSEEARGVQVTIFIVTSEAGFLKLEHFGLDSKWALLGVDVPYLHLISAKASGDDALPVVIKNRTMRDFVGLEDVNKETMVTLVDFNYHLSMGNVDDAFRVVQDIADKEIWERIARISVNTRRVEVALHCFASMGCSTAVAFVRASYDEPEEDTRIAAVAIQLGLLDEARELYLGCKRYDLLNQLYQTCGEWEKAIALASKHDHVDLKQTLHAYARHLESLGKTKDAIHQYELSGTHRWEVPRMLHAAQHNEDLQTYVDKSGDPALHRWWAHLCEANDLVSQAIEYYTLAGDISSLVRVYCFQNDFSLAATLVMKSGDVAAAFDLARQYEKAGDIHQAMKFFSKAGKSNYAARLAMKHSIDNELLALSLQSNKEMMLLAAKYFEDKNRHEEAVLLYHKGGDLEKAINVCFHTQLFEALKAIAEDLKEDSDSVLLAKCGDFLMQHQHVDKAVQLYIAAKQHHKALDLCVREGIMLTDKMAEAMSPNLEEQKSKESTCLLHKVAEVFNGQGSYHLACKKYTQAGDRLSAMKALLRSGDTERIVLFANLSRQNQMYILAANYLQTLDWHHDASIMKTIIQMYTKAGEMESLASFYEACAQIEIDEFRDYQKALGAMKEALKSLSKSRALQRDEKIQCLVNRIMEVEHFVEARRMTRDDPIRMIHACNELLLQLSHSTNMAQASLRVGDIYALMIEFYYNQGHMQQAYQLIEKMQSHKIALGPYIDQRVVRMIYEGLGMEVRCEDLGDGIYEENNIL